MVPLAVEVTLPFKVEIVHAVVGLPVVVVVPDVVVAGAETVVVAAMVEEVVVGASALRVARVADAAQDRSRTL